LKTFPECRELDACLHEAGISICFENFQFWAPAWRRCCSVPACVGYGRKRSESFDETTHACMIQEEEKVLCCQPLCGGWSRLFVFRRFLGIGLVVCQFFFLLRLEEVSEWVVFFWRCRYLREGESGDCLNFWHWFSLLEEVSGGDFLEVQKIWVKQVRFRYLKAQAQWTLCEGSFHLLV